MVWKEYGAGNRRLWRKPRIRACLWPGKGSGEKGQNSQSLAFSRPSRPHRASWKHFCICGIFGNVYETERFMSRNRDWSALQSRSCTPPRPWESCFFVLRQQGRARGSRSIQPGAHQAAALPAPSSQRLHSGFGRHLGVFVSWRHLTLYLIYV